MSGDKELGLYRFLVANNSIEDHLSRFLSLHDLVEGLGMCWVSSSSAIYINPLLVFSSSLLMKTSCLRLKLVELNFFASFNVDDQKKPTFLMFLNTHSSHQDEPFQSSILVQ